MILHTNLLETNEEKKLRKEKRAGRVWRKLTKQALKDQETEDELRSVYSGIQHVEEAVQ